MNKIILGSIEVTGKLLSFEIPSLSLVSSAAEGQFREPEVSISITDNSGRISPAAEGSLYYGSKMRGEKVVVYDFNDRPIYTGFVTRAEAKLSDVTIYCQSMLGYALSRDVELELGEVYPSDAVYKALVEAGLSEMIDQSSFTEALQYYNAFPQTLIVNTTVGDEAAQTVNLSNFINTIVQLTGIDVFINADGYIGCKVFGGYRPAPTLTLDITNIISEPAINGETQTYNKFSIQVLDKSELIATDSDASSVNEYGTQEYSFTPTNGVYVSGYNSAYVFGQRVLLKSAYPRELLTVGVKANVPVFMGDEVLLNFDDLVSGTYEIVGIKYDDYVRELTLVKVDTERLDKYITKSFTGTEYGYNFGNYGVGYYGR